MTLAELAQLAPLVSAVASLAAALVAGIGLTVSLRNSRKIDVGAVKQDAQAVQLQAVHDTTNGLSERAEALARQIGVREGIALQKASQE